MRTEPRAKPQKPAEWLRAGELPEALAGFEREPPPRNRLPVRALSGPIAAFDQLADPRRAAGRRHRLDGVLATAAVGVLAGGRTLADLAAIAAELSQPQLRALRAWLNPTTKRREPPSESTFQRVLSACGPPPRVLQRHHRAGDRLCHHQPLR